ncbi:MAG: protease HtpX [Simkaniaceae bacterium]|nr:protease HtpX [Candidatus Sacchlamyda saccharinae]
MQFFKRIFLFLIINILVLTMVTIVLSIFHVEPYISQYGIQYKDLLIFCLVWGMGGALISLALSRVMAKWMMGVKVIDPKTTDARLSKLLSTVHNLSQKARLPEMPEVGVYKSAEVNAFATGPTKSRSLVAVSSGLLEQMDKDEVEGVLAHEVTHISNGDMVTMTLLQGVVNAFVMFLSRVLAAILSGFSKGDKKGSYGSFMLFTIIFQMVFMVLGSLVVFWYSRKREYAADKGGAHLAGKEKMIAALEKLKVFVKRRVPTAQKEALQTFKISTPSKSGWALLFSSHPPLDERIKALRK